MWVEEKIAGGKLLCIDVKSNKNRISSIKISGDFFIHPEESIDDLESCFSGLSLPLNEDLLRDNIQKATADISIIGFAIEDLIRLFKRAISE